MNKKHLVLFVILDAIIVAGLTYYFVNEYYFTTKPASDATPSEITSEETVPEPATLAPSQGKINPQVACESALIYTTFESGEAADAFVTECVAGEHPEVIERYINEMGMDGAQI